ncbi:hypothetical protein GQ53DRAFT_817393 [Thozetella sp. PMI_491]|nr:hypothetical protein GQ53DRAFT_817393 [Thozetella sp. PMI_491]
MLLFLRVIAALAFAGSSAAADSVGACSEPPLLPWVVSRFDVFQPNTNQSSGTPMRNGSLSINITDPNWLFAGNVPRGKAVFPASTANCTATWVTDVTELYGQSLNCTGVTYGNWTFVIRSRNDGWNPAVLSSLSIELTRIYYVRLPGTQAKKAFEASHMFKQETDLERTEDENGGFWLRLGDTKSINVTQTLYECSGTCQNFVSNYSRGLM